MRQKLFLLALGLSAFSASAQDIASEEFSDFFGAELIQVETKKVEVAKPAETATVPQTQAATSDHSAILERMAMEFFMQQIQSSAKASQASKAPVERAPKTKFFILGYRAGARIGESGSHILSIIELGGWNGNRNFMVAGEITFGNRIGGAMANVGVVVPVRENVFTIVPGFTGGILISSNEARRDYWNWDSRDGRREVQDFSFSGAFLKMLLGNNGRTNFDFTNKILLTRSEITDPIANSNSWSGWGRETREKIGISYIGTIGITLLL